MIDMKFLDDKSVCDNVTYQYLTAYHFCCLLLCFLVIESASLATPTNPVHRVSTKDESLGLPYSLIDTRAKLTSVWRLRQDYQHIISYSPVLIHTVDLVTISVVIQHHCSRTVNPIDMPHPSGLQLVSE